MIKTLALAVALLIPASAHAFMPLGTASDPMFVSCSVGQAQDQSFTITSTVTITGTDVGGVSFKTSGGILSAGDIEGATLTGDGAAITGIVTAGIVDSAINTAKLAAAAVTTAKLANSAVDTTKLASASVTSIKIAAGAVDTAALATDAVTTAKILNSAVNTGKLAADAVTTAKILNANVTLAKMASGSVDTSKISKATGGGAGAALCEMNDGTGKFGHCTAADATVCTCQ